MNNRLAYWTAPKNITALSTTRLSGRSQPPFDSNNLGLHVGDNRLHVELNRQQLKDLLHLPNEPVWLEQTHSTTCIIAEKETNREADAAISHSYLHPLVILTADCLPITLCNTQGSEIAVIHAGWKGLFNGIIENTLTKMNSASSEVFAWIGPAICQTCYEIGEEVYEAFISKYPGSKIAFQPKNAFFNSNFNFKWLANLPLIAEVVLYSIGVKAVFQSHLCTFELEKEFYSYRRNAQTGRIATLIWFNHQP